MCRGSEQRGIIAANGMGTVLCLPLYRDLAPVDIQRTCGLILGS